MPNCSDIANAFRDARLGKVLHVPSGQQTGYPHKSLITFFVEKKIEDLINCTCDRCNSLPLRQPFREDLVATIRDEGNSYVGVLAFLLLHSKWRFIFKFIHRGLSDQKLATLDVGDVPWLPQDLFNQMLSFEEGYESAEYGDFFRFFMPVLQYQDRENGVPMKIHELQILPFNIDKSKPPNRGGFSIVYKAKLLEGYHDFKDVKGGQIAVKIFSDPEVGIEDSNKEMKNNARYKHARVMPLQAVISHREKYMHIYPFAEKSLKELFDDNPSKDFSDDHWWNEFAELLGALDHIHTNKKNEAGYHFDIKPQNILIYHKSWVITDLGLGHYKPACEPGQSKTARRNGTDEYASPEMNVGRSYDVWAMGCIGCEILVWLKGGAAGVKKFHEERKHSEGEPGGITVTVYNFHCGKEKDDLQSAVKDVLSQAKDKDEKSKKIAEILEDMLIRELEGGPDHDPKKNKKSRPKAIEAANRFKKLLDQSPLHNPVTVLPENSEVNNRKHSLAEASQSSEQSKYLTVTGHPPLKRTHCMFCPLQSKQTVSNIF
ncbi:kinase-like domain-containing protein [Trichophaea hybrida]|nr:kinase-like domain-containing protein [Trichophaea hybrida]